MSPRAAADLDQFALDSVLAWFFNLSLVFSNADKHFSKGAGVCLRIFGAGTENCGRF
jgi:hypothetical protein